MIKQKFLHVLNLEVIFVRKGLANYNCVSYFIILGYILHSFVYPLPTHLIKPANKHFASLQKEMTSFSSQIVQVSVSTGFSVS